MQSICVLAQQIFLLGKLLCCILLDRRTLSFSFHLLFPVSLPFLLSSQPTDCFVLTSLNLQDGVNVICHLAWHIFNYLTRHCLVTMCMSKPIFVYMVFGWNVVLAASCIFFSPVMQTISVWQAMCMPVGASVSLLIMFLFFDSLQVVFAICTAGQFNCSFE